MPKFRSNYTISEIEQEFSSVQARARDNDGRIRAISSEQSVSSGGYVERRDALRELEFQGTRKDKYLTDGEKAQRAARRAKAKKVPAAPRQASLDERAKRHERLHERGGRCFVCSGLELHQGGLL